jgi:hypothetical protein
MPKPPSRTAATWVLSCSPRSAGAPHTYSDFWRILMTFASKFSIRCCFQYSAPPSRRSANRLASIGGQKGGVERDRADIAASDIEPRQLLDRQSFCWAAPRVRTPEQMERWTDLVAVVHNALVLARLRSGQAAASSLLQCFQLALRLGMLHPLTNRRVPAAFGSRHNSRRNRVQTDACTRCQQRFLVENRNRLETTFPKSSLQSRCVFLARSLWRSRIGSRDDDRHKIVSERGRVIDGRECGNPGSERWKCGGELFKGLLKRIEIGGHVVDQFLMGLLSRHDFDGVVIADRPSLCPGSILASPIHPDSFAEVDQLRRSD